MKIVRRTCSAAVAVLAFTAVCWTCGKLFASVQQWAGVDESVVEKFAKEHGRTAHEPLINTDQGDLLLFMFLIAGSAGGFAAGYCWKSLTQPRTTETQKKNETIF